MGGGRDTVCREVGRGAKAGLKSTRKGFYITGVTACGCECNHGIKQHADLTGS